MGFYQKQPGMVNGRAWYQSSDGYAIYRAQNGNWHINSKKYLDNNNSDIWASGQSTCPHDISNWIYRILDTVREDTTLKVKHGKIYLKIYKLKFINFHIFFTYLGP